MSNKKLRNVLPWEATWSGEYRDCKFNKYLDYNVVVEVFLGDERVWNKYRHLMPFKHKNIHVWWILEKGIVVGWNENPSRGWSFPVARLKKEMSI